MTLVEKITLLEQVLERLKDETAEALTIQGLYREPEDFIIKDIPQLIRLIKTEDFQFRFNFKDMDSVGRIHARRTGEATGGLFFNPQPPPLVPGYPIDFTTRYTIAYPTGKACGWYIGGLQTNPEFNFVPPITFNFKAMKSMEQHLDFIQTEPEVTE